MQLGQKCHICSKYGHFASQCFKKKLTKKIEYNLDSNSEDSDETELVTKAIKQLVKKGDRKPNNLCNSHD